MQNEGHQVNFIPSPNYNERPQGFPIKYIVLHYTGMKSAQEALARLCDPASQVSAHYMIDEEGKTFQLVEEKNRAWHAGESYWLGVKNLNDISISIELVNPGHEFGYCPFPSAQIVSLKALLHDIMSRHPLQAPAILAHSDIAPTRKEDPGELFPWEELANEGLGIWPIATQNISPPEKMGEKTELLQAVGYDCRDDVAFHASQKAFLRRYHPEALGSGFSFESLCRLRALERTITHTRE